MALHAADVNLVAIPDTVSFEAAASLGCRFATSYRALTGRARLTAGEWVTVVGAGAGGAGLSAVMIAKALGARVIAVDRSPRALAAATALGANHVLAARAGHGLPRRHDHDRPEPRLTGALRVTGDIRRRSPVAPSAGHPR